MHLTLKRQVHKYQLIWSVVYYLLRTPTVPEAKPVAGDDAPAPAPAINFGSLVVDLPCLVLGGRRAEHCPTVECRRYHGVGVALQPDRLRI